MIKHDGSKLDCNSISPKIRQILLHWGYELTDKILRKALNRYPKEKAAQDYLQTKEAIKKSQRTHTETCQKKKKTRLKSIKEKYISH